MTLSTCRCGSQALLRDVLRLGMPGYHAAKVECSNFRCFFRTGELDTRKEAVRVWNVMQKEAKKLLPVECYCGGDPMTVSCRGEVYIMCANNRCKCNTPSVKTEEKAINLWNLMQTEAAK